MTDLPVSTETLDDLEKQIGELIKRDNMTPERVAQTIGDHGKALIRHATAQSRQGMSDLFAEMQNVDSYIADNERALCSEIDRHISMANNARQAAEMLRNTIKGWQTPVSPPKTNGGTS